MLRFDTFVTVAMLAIFSTMVAVASTYPAGARFMPYVIGIPSIGLCLLQLAADIRRSRRAPVAPAETNDEPISVTTELVTWAYFVAFVGAVLLFGFLVSAPFLVTIYLWREAKVRPVYALAAGCGFTMALHLMFERLLTFRLHEGFVTEWVLDRLV
jgi:hypothetical protein